MKIIKRKSAVKPITGSIVDSTNIDDKTTNTYSAEIIDTIIDENNGIEDISDTGITFESGFSKGAGFQLYKQGKRIFGYLSINKATNFGATNGDIKVGTMKYPPKASLYTPVSTGTAFWEIGILGYLAIESTGGMLVKVSDVSKKNIKGYIDYVIN